MKLQIDGREAYAYTGGKPFDPALPTVALVHGAMQDHSVWALQSRWLAHHGHAVLAFDLPGHGRSGGPALPSIEALAAWLIEALHAAGAGSGSGHVALIGHSMGSLVALEAAARLSERAAVAGPPAPSHLLMIGTAFPMRVPPALLELSLTDPLIAIDRVNAFSHSTHAAKPSNPGPGTWLHGASRALMRRQQAAYAAGGHGNLFHHDFGVCDCYAGALQAAAQVACPVRLLLGTQDSMTLPKDSAALASALHAPRQWLATGHALMAEDPDGVLHALREFLAA
jgi:pimeloyl-ACP methyl ester carboxylesterase